VHFMTARLTINRAMTTTTMAQAPKDLRWIPLGLPELLSLSILITAFRRRLYWFFSFFGTASKVKLSTLPQTFLKLIKDMASSPRTGSSRTMEFVSSS
jgi:hypothetical protein